MSTLTYTNSTLTNPADKSEVEANFSDIQSIVNGGIDNSNIAASAGIVNSKLANSHYEFVVNLAVQPTTAVAPPTSAAEPIAVVGIPGDATDGISYTVLSASYITNAAGSGGNTTIEVQFGYYNAGSWTQVGSDVINATNIAGGTEQVSGSLTVSSAGLALSNSQQRFLGLFLTALGTSALDEAHKGLFVTLKIRRTDGLRGT
jgi:hypothetical protein